jgi:hypothetical protein
MPSAARSPAISATEATFAPPTPVCANSGAGNDATCGADESPEPPPEGEGVKLEVALKQNIGSCIPSIAAIRFLPFDPS